MYRREKWTYYRCLASDQLRSYLKRSYRKLGKRYRPNILAGRPVHSAEWGNRWLMERVQSGQPFAAVRYGGYELAAYKAEKARQLGLVEHIPQKFVDNLQNNAGFFPNDLSLLEAYAHISESSSASIDMMATFATEFENYMLRCYVPKQAVVADNRSLEPYYHAHPWTAALAGKRVLVIHPFEDSIRRQYARREALFSRPDILPPFELHTLRAVQTVAGNTDPRFANWFEALQYMYEAAMQIPFDVAILGCGAYGQPLACMLKAAGKQAVHLGGATQILFGIKGRRWDASPEISALYNAAWVRPDESEIPRAAHAVESACYW